jgi:hypothetical protein
VLLAQIQEKQEQEKEARSIKEAHNEMHDGEDGTDDGVTPRHIQRISKGNRKQEGRRGSLVA